MSRKTVDVEIKSFIGGLVSEANPLTFPDNASLDELNFDLHQDGTRTRRLGMDNHSSVTRWDVGSYVGSLDSCRSYLWEGAGEEGVLDIVVVVTEGNMRFFSAGSYNTLLFAGGIEDTDGNSLGGPVLTNVGSTSTDVNFTTINGSLVIANGDKEVRALAYNSDSDTGLVTIVAPETRDLWGLDTSVIIDIQQRPTDVDLRALNGGSNRGLLFYREALLNQGWDAQVRNATNDRGVGTNMPAPAYDYIVNNTTPAIHPSMTDVVWSSVDPTGLLSIINWEQQVQGNTRAPMGHEIRSIFTQNITMEAMFDNFLSDAHIEADGAITNVGTYAGRCFYTLEADTISAANKNAPNLNSLIFYSKVVSKDEDLQVCHSVADPTSQDSPGIVDSDGGFIQIAGMGTVHEMKAVGRSLYVVSTTGVWEIHGGREAFSANNQQVDQISTVGCIAARSVVVENQRLFYWSQSGIMAVTLEDRDQGAKVQNVTDKTLKQYYNALPNKESAAGAFDPIAGEIRWLYGFNNGASLNTRPNELVFSLLKGSFNPITITNGNSEVSTGPYVVDSFSVTSPSPLTTPFDRARKSLVYLTIGGVDGAAFANTEISFGGYINEDFEDWGQWHVDKGIGTAVDAPAHLLTGYLTGGNVSKDKQSNYLHVQMNITEDGFQDDGGGNYSFTSPSGCLVQAQWEWSNSAANGRWTPEFEAYRLPRYYGVVDDVSPFDYGFTLMTSKSRLRGKGAALSLSFKSEPGKDCQILGWGHKLMAETK